MAAASTFRIIQPKHEAYFGPAYFGLLWTADGHDRRARSAGPRLQRRWKHFHRTRRRHNQAHGDGDGYRSRAVAARQFVVYTRQGRGRSRRHYEPHQFCPTEPRPDELRRIDVDGSDDRTLLKGRGGGPSISSA